MNHACELFRFDRKRSQRQPKQRGVLRRANQAVSNCHTYDRVLGPDDVWFQHWHQHLDWKGLGNRGFRVRRVFLEGYARLFAHLAMQAKNLGQPYQIWIGLSQEDAGYDAVFLHTKNPHSDFPIQLQGVQWDVPELIALFSPWLPGFNLVAGRGEEVLYLYAEGHRISLRSKSNGESDLRLKA